MHTNTGFTLIELLVLVTIIGILAAVALPNFSATIKGNRDVTYVNALASGLALARSEGIKQGSATICAGDSVTCNGTNWSDGWVVFTTAPSGTTTLVQTFPATFGATVNGSGGSQIAFNSAGMSFTSNSFTTPAASSFAVCDSRGPKFGYSLNLLPSGGAQAGNRMGYQIDGTTPLDCAPVSAMPSGGGGALGVPGLMLLGSLLVLLGFRKHPGASNKMRTGSLWKRNCGSSPSCGSGRPGRDNTGIASNLATSATLQHRSATAGFSLLEVLIALVILSVGLLGIAGLLSGTLKSNDSAYMRTVATVQAYNIIDRMRANNTAIGSLEYVHSMPASPATTSSAACTSSGADCDTSQLAAYDIKQWEYELAQNLPQGRGSISTTITPTATTYTVTIQWNDTRANQALQGNVSANTSSLSVTSG